MGFPPDPSTISTYLQRTDGFEEGEEVIFDELTGFESYQFISGAYKASEERDYLMLLA